MPEGLLHILFSLRAEGCPRLALALIKEQIQQTGEHGTVAVASDAYTDLEPEFRNLQIPIFSLGWRRHGFVVLLKKVYRLLSQVQPRGIICYTVGLHVPIAIAAWKHNLPIVVHLGNSPPSSDRIARLKIFLEMLAGKPFVTRYAACSEYVREESIRTYKLPPNRVVTVPNGIHLRDFNPVGSNKIQRNGRNPLVVGMVGSFETHKDQETLLEAISSIKSRGKDVRLRLIGAGSKESFLRARASQLGISDCVEWRGSVIDVARELSQLDLFAYSVREEEGLGIALIEALAAGLPVVASDVGACREVLDGGRFGRLVKPGNVDEWATALSEPLTAETMPVDFLSRYDISKTLRAYNALLAQV